MDPSVWFLLSLGKLVFVMLLIGWIPALIASSKGRNFLLWWVYGGALFIVALIHALLIKDIASKTVTELAALNRCDGCGADFRSFYGLEKVEGKGFLCAQCRAASPVPAVQSSGAASAG